MAKPAPCPWMAKPLPPGPTRTSTPEALDFWVHPRIGRAFIGSGCLTLTAPPRSNRNDEYSYANTCQGTESADARTRSGGKEWGLPESSGARRYAPPGGEARGGP